MVISLTDLYGFLSAKLRKAEAKSPVSFVEEKVEREVALKTTHLASREDLEKGFKEQTRWMLATFITK